MHIFTAYSDNMQYDAEQGLWTIVNFTLLRVLWPRTFIWFSISGNKTRQELIPTHWGKTIGIWCLKWCFKAWKFALTVRSLVCCPSLVQLIPKCAIGIRNKWKYKRQVASNKEKLLYLRLSLVPKEFVFNSPIFSSTSVSPVLSCPPGAGFGHWLQKHYSRYTFWISLF